MNRSVCIIPARKGSKRIKNKNKKIFIDKPIIEYVIKICQESKLFDRIIIATDDEDIIAITDNYADVSCFKRNPENADDTSPLAAVVEEVLLGTHAEYEYGCCVLPTAVFMQVEDLVNGFDKLQMKNVDSVAAFLKYRYPIQRAVSFNSQHKVNMLSPEHRWTRTQDLAEIYHDAGQFYWFRTDVGLKGARKYGVLLRNQNAIDIDNPDDWNLAQQLYKFKNE